MLRIQNEFLSADVSANGAELIGLREQGGGELLWDGNPEWWSGRSPLLFPIVGRVPHNNIIVSGERYTVHQHGFARRSKFDLVSAEAASCQLRLVASSESRTQFPFNFELVVNYSIVGQALTAIATVLNLSNQPMPVSFGFHPALRWPLPCGGSRERHFIEFETSEPNPIRKLRDGLLIPETFETPIVERFLILSDALFEEGAIVMDKLRSRSLTYVSPLGKSIHFEFPSMPHLGIWSKPGAGFVCIEPWQGYAAEEGFTGELSEKLGTIMIGPGAARKFSMRITLAL